MTKSSLALRRLTISAVLLSIALILKTTTSFYLPLFGESGMRVGISGIFSIIPSLLFGPWYGALVSGASDLLGYLLKPTGPYIPIMTLIMALGGFLRGLLWNLLKDKDSRRIRLVVALCTVLLLGAGIFNIVHFAADGVSADYYHNTDAEINTEQMHLISRLVIARTVNTKDPTANLKVYLTTLTMGLVGAAVLGMLLLLADVVIGKRFLADREQSRVPQLLLAMVISGLVVTTLNTLVLRETVYTSWQLLPFAAVWLPRVVEEVVGNTVKAYFVAVLLGVLKRRLGLNSVLKSEVKNV